MRLTQVGGEVRGGKRGEGKEGKLRHSLEPRRRSWPQRRMIRGSTCALSSQLDPSSRANTSVLKRVDWRFFVRLSRTSTVAFFAAGSQLQPNVATHVMEESGFDFQCITFYLAGVRPRCPQPPPYRNALGPYRRTFMPNSCGAFLPCACAAMAALLRPTLRSLNSTNSCGCFLPAASAISTSTLRKEKEQ